MQHPHATPSDFLDVRIFHKKFGQPTDMPSKDGLGVEPPILMPEDQFTFRRKFLFEEFDEYSTGHNKGNLIKAADALFDLQYVLFGTALFMRAGVGYFVPRSWPTFEWVKDNAGKLGLLSAATPFPRLLTQSAHEIQHEQMGGLLEQFRMAHQSAEPNAVAYCLAILWNLSYSIYLTAAMMSIPWKDCWSFVQEANMAKIRAQRDGSDSTRGSGWDVVKPSGWRAPDSLIAARLLQAGATIPPEFVNEADKASEPKS